MVGRGGVEPPTFHFSGGRSYQLSYLPNSAEAYRRSGVVPNRGQEAKSTAARTISGPGCSATPTGLEPAASAVTGRRANQLRYGALIVLLVVLVLPSDCVDRRAQC